MGTRYRGKPEEVRALDAFIKLMRASDAVGARVHKGIGASGVTPTQFGILEALYHLGPSCQRMLAGKVLKSGGNVTVVVDNLEKRGLVARERDEHDRRFVTVRLTREGQKLIRRLFPLARDAIVRELAALRPGEQEEMARLLRKVGRGAAEN